MKFAHLADVHLGGWRDPRLREANTRAFLKAMQTCIDENVDFVIIAGDLFNTAQPAMDCLRTCVQEFRKLREKSIPVYLVAGSHDFSPSGKTMLDILEEAGLATNVARGTVENGKLKLAFTVDKKTGVKLTGIPGKKGQLEKYYYDDLLLEHLEKEPGKKIFVFHTSIAELKPKELAQMEALSISSFPKGFDYYAGGHIHIVRHERLSAYPNVVYPGPVFPNNFSELEKLECGNMVIVEDFVPRHVKLALHPVVKAGIDATNKTPEEARELIADAFKGKNVKNAIVLLRVFGKLNGRPGDIPFPDIARQLFAQGAHIVLRNTGKLESPEYEEIKVHGGSIDELEANIIKEHAGKSKLVHSEHELITQLMKSFSAEKGDAERAVDFEKRIVDDADKEFGH